MPEDTIRLVLPAAPQFAPVASVAVRAAARQVALPEDEIGRLRTALVAMQIGACALFLVGATGLVDEARSLSNLETGLSYERVANVNISPRLRAAVARRLESDPAVERVAAAWQPPLSGPLRSFGLVASDTGI